MLESEIAAKRPLLAGKDLLEISSQYVRGILEMYVGDEDIVLLYGDFLIVSP